MSQLTMISDALSIDFKWNVPLDQMVQQIHTTNEAIWVMGAPLPKVFLLLLLVCVVQELSRFVQGHQQLYRCSHKAVPFHLRFHHQSYRSRTS